YGFGAAAHIIAQIAVHDGREVFAFTSPGDDTAQRFARTLGAAWAGAATEPPPAPLDAAIVFAPAGQLVPEALAHVAPGGAVVCETTAQDQAVVERRRELGIAFERYEHPPAATVGEDERHWVGIDAMHCKNLFLRNQKGTRHYLVILVASKKADLRAVAEQIGDGKLSFASPARLMTYLGLTPGSVSPFGLIHDSERNVRVVLDRDLKIASRVSFH